jgi:putative transposase
MKQADGLIVGFHPNYVTADRAYDADGLMDAILEAGAEPVISPGRQQRHRHYHDNVLYEGRNQIERLFAKLKEFRRIATSYDKLLRNFPGLVNIAAISIRLR